MMLHKHKVGDVDAPVELSVKASKKVDALVNVDSGVASGQPVIWFSGLAESYPSADWPNRNPIQLTMDLTVL